MGANELAQAQLLHTHRCPHGVNKCDCMLATSQHAMASSQHAMARHEQSRLVEVQVVYRIRCLMLPHLV
jgi:hypothetical protein